MKKLCADNKIIAKLRSFFEGWYFPVSLGAVLFLCYALGLEMLPLILIAASFVFICLFSEDTRPGLAALLLGFLSLRYKYDLSAYVSVGAIVTYAVGGMLVAAAVVYRLLITERITHKRTLWISLSLLGVGFLLGGVGSKHYELHSFLVAISNTALLIVIYLFFSFTMKPRKDNLVYLARVCAVAICVIALQVAELYLRSFTLDMRLDGEWKEYGLIVGWGISNLIGEMLVTLLPAVFYLIYKEKRGYWYYLVVAIACVATYFTLARGALLCEFFVVLAGVIVNCIFGKNKWLNVAMASVLFLGLVGALAYLQISGKGRAIFTFFVEAGFSDRGRFELWEACVELWKTSPVFGVSFSAYRHLELQKETLYSAHNTFIQMLSGTGIVGLTAYVIHRGHTVWLLFKKPCLDRFFMSACLVSALAVSLVGPLFFRVYFLIYYAVFLMALEKSLEADERNKKGKKQGAIKIEDEPVTME